jgi:hypothetical protein
MNRQPAPSSVASRVNDRLSAEVGMVVVTRAFLRLGCVAGVFEEVAASLRLKAVEGLTDVLPETLAGPLAV